MLRPLFTSLLLATALPAAETAPALAGLTYSGDQSEVAALDREIVAAGKDPAKLAALEARLLALLRRTDTTFASRQAVAQRLGLVLAVAAPKTSANALKPLGAMLLDERDSDLARFALERAAGPLVEDLFINAVGKTSGRVRLGIIDSLGRLRVATAVPALTQLLADKDPATAGAAARALAAIGTAAADAALRAASALPRTLLAQSRLDATAHLPAADAARVLAELQGDPQLPANLRAAAFRRSLDVSPADSATRLAGVLGGNDWTLKQAALEALANAMPADRVPAILAGLASWDAPTQAGAIAALGRSGSAAAVPAVATATQHGSPEVRTEAFSALGLLPGSREIVTLLAAAAADATEAKLARQSLARLNGPDVSAAILAGAEKSAPPLRVVFLEQLALRNMTEAIPLLKRSRSDPDAAVRAAAVGALGELAPFSEQAAVLDWAIGATEETEQSRALRALVNVTLRSRSVADRGRAVYAALETAPPEVALRLLPALARLGGTPSADCAAGLAVRDDAALAAAAVDALGRWTDATALSALASVAEKAAIASVRDRARSAAVRHLDRNREAWSPATTALIARLTAATTVAAERQPLLRLLARANDRAALTLAESLRADATLGAEARYAAAAIKAALAGAPVARASRMSGVSQLLDGKTGTRWNTALLGEEWIEIDLRAARPLRRITLDQTGRAAEFPEHYAVHVTNDTAKPGPAVVQGKGQRNQTVIELPPGTEGRYVLIKNTAERADPAWSVSEIYLD